MKIAVLIPCYNEELTIADVVLGFKKELPEAEIYVYDNNSNDRTSEIARLHGAIVRLENRQGKGNVVRSMFRDVDADIYVMVDGDNTYLSEDVHALTEAIENGEADMVVGDRFSSGVYLKENKRMFHNCGNILVRKLINFVFKEKMTDIMSGYRAFSREFVKNTPLLSSGFEIETEMTIHALDKRFRVREIPIAYRDRSEGSVSKLNTFSDGFRVIKTIFFMFKDYKPFQFFGSLALMFFTLGIVAGIPPIIEYMSERYVYRLPLAVLAVGLVLLSTLLLSCGIILDTVTKLHKEKYELMLNEYRRGSKVS